MLFSLISFLAGYRYEETSKKTFILSQEGLIKLNDINGNVKILTHAGSDINIKLVQKANSRAEFGKMEVEFLADENKLEIQVIKKEKDCKVRIDFFLKVPEKLASVSLLTILGNIEAEGQYREIKLKTVNGQIDFEGNFTGADFSTVSDDINLLLKDTLQGDMQVKTYNGDINIELDPDSGFQIEAAAVNGRIKSEFKLSTRKTFMGQETRGSFNNGQHLVSLKTQNGNIKILKK